MSVHFIMLIMEAKLDWIYDSPPPTGTRGGVKSQKRDQKPNETQIGQAMVSCLGAYCQGTLPSIVIVINCASLKEKDKERGGKATAGFKGHYIFLELMCGLTALSLYKQLWVIPLCLRRLLLLRLLNRYFYLLCMSLTCLGLDSGHRGSNEWCHCFEHTAASLFWILARN